ncbi:E3 ubiquitin-protein ligase RHF1A-like [Rhagoletis pomonella]|uniref:E3 ubiquitin-protein ligase RHF1A-like n=1 Tax=Rhagoletis pomonella TaxID=28610 RepID=UPI00177F9987|nr:E3 ubiquitin-protein ligase RHF1A-like [Rhagoletis pomonella]
MSPPMQTVCTICRENFSERDEVLVASCSHRFHRTGLLSWLKKNSSCPQCRALCTSRDFHSNTGVRTRSRTPGLDTSKTGSNNNMNLQTSSDTTPQQHPQSEGACGLPIAGGDTTSVKDKEEENRVRNLVSAVISARHAAIFDNLESQVSQLIEHRIESTLANVLERMNLNHEQPAVRGSNVSPAANASAAHPAPNGSTPTWPRDAPSLVNLSNQNFINQIESSPANSQLGC